MTDFETHPVGTTALLTNMLEEMEWALPILRRKLDCPLDLVPFEEVIAAAKAAMNR